MTDRRKFLQSAGTLVGGSLLFPDMLSAHFRQKTHPVGVQLFTFFETIDKDVKGTLEKIAATGYREIESAFSKLGGYYGMKPKEFATYVASLGMSWQSHHVLGAPFELPKGSKMPMGSDGKPIELPPIKNLRDNMQEIIDDMSEAGVPYLVCASTPIDTLDAVKRSIEVLNKSAEACHKAGIQLCYHNHYKEFEPIDGTAPYDLLLNETNSQHLKFELDLAWAVKAGQNPVDLFKAHPGRFPLWHVKDLNKDKETVEPVGRGIVDYKTIFAHAKTGGMKHFFVEHDMPSNPMESIRTSYTYITKTLGI
ncbi:MAG: sugar phosphate isomerase/epimerase [Chitinophagaceae bacterium]